MLAGISLLWLSGGHLAGQLRDIFRQGFLFDNFYLQNPGLMLRFLGKVIGEALFAMLPVVGGLALVGISASALVGGLAFNTKSIKFDLTKLSPLKGFKRIFSMNALAELFKAILKSLLIGTGAWIFMAGMAVLTASGDGIPVNGNGQCDAESDFCRLPHYFHADPDGGV